MVITSLNNNKKYIIIIKITITISVQNFGVEKINTPKTVILRNIITI